MIYCPHCNRPSAKKNGPCPHCKGDLTAKKGSSPKGPLPAAAKNAPLANEAPQIDEAPPLTESPSLDTTGGETGALKHSSASELELDSGTGPSIVERETASSGLALASLAPNHPAEMDETLNVPKKLDELAIKDAAGFGNIGSGSIDAVKYWLRVRKRQQELVSETQAAQQEKSKVSLNVQETCAVLGRKGHEIGIKDSALEALKGKALLAEGEFEGSKRRREGLLSEHQDKMEPLEAQLKAVETETAPLREQEKLAVEEHSKLESAYKGIQVQLKRVEIELRNIDEIIEKKQKEFGDLEKPKEERDQLLVNISSFDNKRPALLERVNGFKQELSKAAEPQAKSEAALNEINSKLGEKQGRINGLKAELKRLADQFLAAQGNASKDVQGESGKLEQAWAEVGQHIVSSKTKEPLLGDDLKKARLSMANLSLAQEKIELLETAAESYDESVMAKGKQTVMIAAGAAVGLIILLIVLAVI